jgi:predicted unusual protein kinase regulating ubiquinone biosynthesis (AarF/ABC1/UbiB family)
MGNLEANFSLRAVQLRDLLGQLGPSFVKVGQALSSRPDLLPQVYLEVSPISSPRDYTYGG